ncbi:MAG TPA: universal stress protein [Candidatus Binatia bacterium]|nr:universal stress protein [Candidatus Binatia bacterium]
MARNTRDSLIAMCSHGRSGVSRWMLGSVTDKVVHHAENPVLILRAR